MSFALGRRIVRAQEFAQAHPAATEILNFIWA
jgi:hypothetical protein